MLLYISCEYFPSSYLLTAKIFNKCLIDGQSTKNYTLRFYSTISPHFSSSTSFSKREVLAWCQYVISCRKFVTSRKFRCYFSFVITRTLVGQVPAIEITEIDMTLVWCGLTVLANQNQGYLNIVTRSIVLQPIKSFVFHKYQFHVLKDSVEVPFKR